MLRSGVVALLLLTPLAAAPAASGAWPKRLPGTTVGVASAGATTVVMTRSRVASYATTLGRRGRSRTVKLPLGAGSGYAAAVTMTRSGEVIATQRAYVRGTPADPSLASVESTSCCERVLLTRMRPGRRPSAARPISPEGHEAADKSGRNGTELRAVPLGAAGALVAYPVRRERQAARGVDEVQLTHVTPGGTRTIAGGALAGADLIDLGELPGGRAGLTIMRYLEGDRTVVEQIVIEAGGRLGAPQRIHEAPPGEIGAFRVVSAGERRLVAGTKLLTGGAFGEPLGPSGDPGFIYWEYVDSGASAAGGDLAVFSALRSRDRTGAAFFTVAGNGAPVTRTAPALDRALSHAEVALGPRGGAYGVTTGPSMLDPAQIEVGRITPEGDLGPPKTLRSRLMGRRTCWIEALIQPRRGRFLAATVCRPVGNPGTEPEHPLVRVSL